MGSKVKVKVEGQLQARSKEVRSELNFGLDVVESEMQHRPQSLMATKHQEWTEKGGDCVCTPMP